jgi:Mn-dependent transcriptional regulator
MAHKNHMQSSEDYLKAMFILQGREDQIRPVDLSVQIGYTKPSISRAISMLCKEKLLTKDGNGHIHLTDKKLKARIEV